MDSSKGLNPSKPYSPHLQNGNHESIFMRIREHAEDSRYHGTEMSCLKCQRWLLCHQHQDRHRTELVTSLWSAISPHPASFSDHSGDITFTLPFISYSDYLIHSITFLLPPLFLQLDHNNLLIINALLK